MKSVLPWLLLTLAAGAGGARELTASRCAEPPALDGRLDDACWQAGEWQAGFTLLNAPERVAPVQTRVQLAHDDAWLYVAARLDEPAMDGLRAEVTERDGRVYSEDALEVMIDADGDGVEYYHFAINPRGTLYDAQMRQGGHVRSAEWDSGARVATARGEDHWSAELALPLAELGLNAGSRGDWLINIGRERRAGPVEELSSFAPTTGGFHQPTQFATLQLADADLGRYLWEVKAPYDTRVRAGDGGLVYGGKTFLTNQGEAFRFVRVVATLQPADGAATEQVLTRGLDAGQGGEIPLAIPAPVTGPAVLSIAVLDRGSGDTLAIQRFAVEVSYTPLSIALSRPAWRNSIYATETVGTVEGVVTAGLEPAALEGRTLRVALTRGEETLAETIAPAQTATPFALPAADLAVGSYTLVAQLRDAGGDVVHEATAPLAKLAPHPNEMRLDEHQVLRHNGEPFLVFGWFSLWADDYAQAREQGITALVDYGAQWRSEEEHREYLDAVAAAGLKVASYPYPNPRMLDRERWGQPLSDEEAEAIRQRVRAFKDHPALLGWYIADEPELRPTLPERTEAIHRVVADEDPYHPTIMLNDTIAGIHKYVGGGDVLMPDPYPLFIEGGGAGRSMEYTSKFMKAVQEVGAGEKAAWITPQAFNYGDYGQLNNRAPTLVEMRNQMVQAIIAKTTGFLWYTYGQNRNYPQLGLGMPFLASEAHALAPAILAPQSDEPVRITPADAPVRASLRRAGEHWYLFAVSTATEPVEVTLALPEGAPAEWHAVSEARGATAVDGVLTQRFEPYASHLYTTDAAAAEAQSLAATQHAIAAADAARRREGNLAFEDRGARVTVSSEATYGSTPSRVLDGIRGYMGWRDGTLDKYPDWLQLTWPEPVHAARVEVYSPNLVEGHLERQEGDEWVTLAPLTRADAERLTATFEPRDLSVLRVVVTKSSERWVNVSEVEVYAE